MFELAPPYWWAGGRSRRVTRARAARDLHIARAMINIKHIKAHAAVVGTNSTDFGVVAGMDGPNSIKLEKDSSGRHHYIPLTWVTMIDEKVHIDRSSEQAMREWSTISASN